MQSQLERIAPAALSVFLLAACARQAPAPLFKDTLHSESATVESVDPATRHIRLHSADGTQEVVAGPEVRNFDQIKPGDTVTVSYYAAFTAEVKPKGVASTTQEHTSEAYAAAPGERPAAELHNTTVETVRIQSVDKQAHTVTFQRQDGSVDTVEVHAGDAQTFVAGLRPGDDVDMAYTEAFAVSVTEQP
jgi:hypothetical protein